MIHSIADFEITTLVVSSGRTPTAVAGEVGLHPTLLCRWIHQYKGGADNAEALRLAATPSLKPVPVPTAGYYAWRSRPDSRRTVENRALLVDIRQAHADSGGRYGSPRVHAVLRAHGRKAGRGRIERLMRRQGVRGLMAQRRRVQTTDSCHPFPIAPNLLNRKFSATNRPNEVWLADLTYIAPQSAATWL